MPVPLECDSEAPVVAIDLLEAAAGGEQGASPLRDESVVSIGSSADVVTARERGRSLAAGLGFSACDQLMITTAISELARNILEFATRGRIAMIPTRIEGRLGIVIEAHDEGPGIADLARVVEGGYSPGFGLPGVRRLMDEFDIASELGKGTTVTAKKWQLRAAGGRGSRGGGTIVLESPGDTHCPTAP